MNRTIHKTIVSREWHQDGKHYAQVVVACDCAYPFDWFSTRDEDVNCNGCKLAKLTPIPKVRTIQLFVDGKPFIPRTA